MKPIKIFSTLIIFFTFCGNVCAQSTSTQGTEFWVTFMQNYNKYETNGLSLMLSSKDTCSGKIVNPKTGWSKSFKISSDGLLKIDLDYKECYNTVSEVIGSKALFITSTDTISVFASNYQRMSFDNTNVLPVGALMDEYIVQMYKSAFYGSEFVVIGTEDSTIVDITPTAMTEKGNSQGVPFQVKLNKGDTYLVKTHSDYTDFSGTLIKARDCKKIAVFNGNLLTQVPIGYEAGDHLFEQAIPTAYWGSKFAITRTALRSSDRIAVTALKDGTVIKKNGVVVATIDALKSYEFELNGAEQSCFLETSQPASVFLYLVGVSYGGSNIGDPSMLWVSPIEQKIDQITFGTYETTEIKTHYVNIVVATKDTASVTFDGGKISEEFSKLSGNSDYSFARKKILHGTHTIKNKNGFTAHVYGLGHRESYAYSAGSATADLQTTIWIGGTMYVDDLFLVKHVCIVDSVDFSLSLNYPYEEIFWDFGDGTTAKGVHNKHFYSDLGEYEIKVVVKRQYINCLGQLYDTATAKIKTTRLEPFTEIWDTVCFKNDYKKYGFDYFALKDTTLVNLIPTFGCDSTVNLHLKVMTLYNDTIKSTICLGERYKQYNFDETPKFPGIFFYSQNLATKFGCDSIVTLNLTVKSTYNDTIKSTICLGERYKQYNFDETPKFPGIFFYSQNLATKFGCDSIVTLNLTVKPTYNDTIKSTICFGERYKQYNFDETPKFPGIFFIRKIWLPA